MNILGIPGLEWYVVLVWLLLLLTWVTVRPRATGAAMRFVSAMNSINTPWIAIFVIGLGMVFDVACQKFNISTDAATGVIGAGIGMLTAQGAHALNQLAQLQLQAAQLTQKPAATPGPSQPVADPAAESAKE